MEVKMRGTCSVAFKRIMYLFMCGVYHLKWEQIKWLKRLKFNSVVDIQSIPVRRPLTPRLALSHFSNACIYNSTWRNIFSILHFSCSNPHIYSYFENGSEEWAIWLFDSVNLKNEFLAQHNARDNIVPTIVWNANMNEFPLMSFFVFNATAHLWTRSRKHNFAWHADICRNIPRARCDNKVARFNRLVTKYSLIKCSASSLKRTGLCPI